jgi:hypothetical protein
MNYPEEWDELPKHERRKKIKRLKKQREEKRARVNKLRNIVVVVVLVGVGVFGYRWARQKTAEEVEREARIEAVSLEGRVEEFTIEGTAHIAPGQTTNYNTNPPTSGSHYAQPANWAFYDRELKDEQLVHNLEHGGIWISYKDLDEQGLERLKTIAKNNPDSVIVTERQKNDNPIVVASWGKMMRLIEVDEAVTQKSLDRYINQSPEPLAR